MSSPSIVTLLTDFGSGSYVAQMKGVLLGHRRDLQIVDIAHDIEPQNIRQAAWLLADAIAPFPSGSLHIAIIDPGVGSKRAMIYAEIGVWRFLAPDNGLLSRVAAKWETHRVVRMDRKEFWRQPTSQTFHGRDICCEVAGHLLNGLEPDRLGDRQASIVPLTLNSPSMDLHGRALGEIVYFDAFGNAVTNIERSWLESVWGNAAGDLLIEIEASPLKAVWLDHYAAAPSRSTVALFGSNNWLEIAVVNGNARTELDLKVGSKVSLRRNG